VVKKLWKEIDLGVEYPWNIGPTTQQRLHEILPQLPADLFTLDGHKLNRAIRDAVGPHLKAKDANSLRLARWVIKDWEGSDV